MKKKRIKKNDIVYIKTGKDKGKVGKILQVFYKNDKLLVEGINYVKKAQKPDPGKGIHGGLQQQEAPIHISNVMLYCEKCKKPVRVKMERDDKGNRIRHCKKCGSSLERNK